MLHAGRTLLLHEGPNVIGRDPDVAIVIDSPKVSRRHALITINAGGATMSDLGSKNGTFVNGVRVRSPIFLSDGDEITVGSTRLVFRSAPIAGPTETDPGA